MGAEVLVRWLKTENMFYPVNLSRFSKKTILFTNSTNTFGSERAYCCANG